MTLHRTPRMALVLVLVLLTLLPRVGWPSRAEAATLAFAVTSATDAPDATPGDGLCASTAGGACTLRAAVQEANAQPLGSAVHVALPAGHYLLTLGELDVISSTVIISGAGAATTVVDAEGHSRVLRVSAGSTVGLALLTLTGGATPAKSSGGGLYNSGTLAITNSAIRGNTASRGDGGGLYNNNNGTLAITNSMISSNTASGGGGLYNSGALTIINSAIRDNTNGGLYNKGTLAITNSAIISNTASLFGGGLFNNSLLTLTNSTVSGNAAAQGAGLYASGGCCVFPTAVAIAYSTISNNTATTQGGGLDNESGLALVVVTGTLLAGNAPANCAGTPATEGQGYNLDSGVSCGLAQPTDLSTTNPLLGPLAYNGGPTPTMALLPGSPAIDHGGASATGCPATDQRGIRRPQGPACDIGAFERKAGSTPEYLNQ